MFYKIFISLLMVGSFHLQADDSVIASQIIDRTVSSLFGGEKVMTWGDTAANIQIISQSAKMEIINDPHSAQFMIISKKIPDDISKKTILFTTEYNLLSKDERIIGAFFWQKGRPNLLFLRDRLKKADLKLGKEFNKFIEDEL